MKILSPEERDRILKLAGIKFHDGSSYEIAQAQAALTRRETAEEIIKLLKDKKYYCNHDPAYRCPKCYSFISLLKYDKLINELKKQYTEAP